MGQSSASKSRSDRLDLQGLRAAVLAIAEGAPAPALRADPQLDRALKRLARPQVTGVLSERQPVLIATSANSAARVLVIAKVDRFEALSVSLGSAIADGLLFALRQRIVLGLSNVTIGRVGRGLMEFTLVPADPEAVEAELLQLHEALEQPAIVEGETFTSPIIIGATRLLAAPSTPDALRQAERALARAELSGTKLHVFCEKERADASERLSLMRDLRAAIAEGQLFLVYQPKLNLRTGRIDSIEALVRWRHPTRGVVSPDQFIEMAEDTGDIGRITEVVLKAALRDLGALGGDGPSLYVNLSGRLVTDDAFCGWIVETCRDFSGRIGVEITETAVIADPDHALRNLNSLAQAGISIAIDDYGAGLSSLAYLKALPANELKIDKSFVLGLSSSHRDPLIVRSTIDLAHALGMEVAAEGVDDPTALALLRVMGCDRVQGYLIAAPMELEALQTFMAEQESGSSSRFQPSHPLLRLRR